MSPTKVFSRCIECGGVILVKRIAAGKVWTWKIKLLCSRHWLPVAKRWSHKAQFSNLVTWPLVVCSDAVLTVRQPSSHPMCVFNIYIVVWCVLLQKHGVTLSCFYCLRLFCMSHITKPRPLCRYCASMVNEEVMPLLLLCSVCVDRWVTTQKGSKVP